MIAKKGSLLALVLCLYMGTACGEITKSPRTAVGRELAEVSLTAEQAEQIVHSLEAVIKQAREDDQQNKAGRPTSAVPCDGVFPACTIFDLSELSACCCAIKNILCCFSVSVLDVLGACTDASILLPSTVDKSDIDAICASTITLLKTILLELRGAFVTLT
jgi:hypothetical protein